MEPKHSGLGIASFVVSITAAIFIFVLIAVAGALELSTPGGIDEESVSVMMIGLLLFAFLSASVVALGLGIGGLFQNDRKNVFAILGTVFSALTLIGMFFFML